MVHRAVLRVVDAAAEGGVGVALLRTADEGHDVAVGVECNSGVTPLQPYTSIDGRYALPICRIAFYERVTFSNSVSVENLDSYSAYDPLDVGTAKLITNESLVK